MAKKKSQTQRAQRKVVVPVKEPTTPHPLAEFAGMYKDDPLVEEWKKSMAAYRRKVDKDADQP